MAVNETNSLEEFYSEKKMSKSEIRLLRKIGNSTSNSRFSINPYEPDNPNSFVYEGYQKIPFFGSFDEDGKFNNKSLFDLLLEGELPSPAL